MIRRLLPLALLLSGCPREPEEQRPEAPAVQLAVPTSTGAITYRVSFPQHRMHYVDVRGVFPADGRDQLTLTMPVWTPGSYLVREFSRHVHDLTARSEKGALQVAKVRKNRWRITLDGSPAVEVRYRLYARQGNVRDNFVDRDLALLNGAPSFFADAEHLDWVYRVELALPEGWGTALSCMPSDPKAPHAFLAESYDVLVDSPILAGNPAVHRFEVGGVEHLLVDAGEDGVFDGARAAKDVEKVVKTAAAFWGSIPYPRYVFYNILNESGGGLEHHNGTVIMSSRWATRDEDRYRSWLRTVSHEHFHAWNGKRLRPAALGPFDYEAEVYTTDLWVVEGLTSYFEDLLLARAGLIDEAKYLEVLSKQIEAVETAPGRQHDSLADASYNAWIEFYRWDENTNNTSISYYDKGSVVGFLLDAAIRRETNDARSLDDVMREAYRRYSGARGYTTGELYGVVEAVAGKRVRDQLVRMVETTGELSYQPAFDWYGLEVEPPSAGDLKKPLLGVKSERQNNRLIVTEVTDASPAYDAGINAGDELVGIGGFRVEDLEQQLTRYHPKDEVKVLVARRGELLELQVTLGERSKRGFKLRPKKMRSATQIQRLQKLL